MNASGNPTMRIYDEAAEGMMWLPATTVEQIAILMSESADDAHESGDTEGEIVSGLAMRAALNTLRAHGDASKRLLHFCGYSA